MKKTVKTILILGSVASAITLAIALFPTKKSVQIQGQVEAKHYSISSKIAGRIATIGVKKGDTVEKGRFIFSIDSPELAAKVAQAKANQKAVKAQKKQILKGTRKQNISAAYNQWQKASASVRLLEKTYQRLEKLYAQDVVAEQKRDEAYAKLQMAKFTEASAYETYQLAKEGAQSETKDAIVQKENAATQKVAEIEAYAQDIRQNSLYNGEVTHVLLEEGELAAAGLPVVRIVDLSNTWAVFTVREDMLPAIKKGASVMVKIPALGKEKSYSYTIDYIAAMGDFATWKSTQNGGDFDLRTFEVHARPSAPIDNIRVGMSAIITIEMP